MLAHRWEYWVNSESSDDLPENSDEFPETSESLTSFLKTLPKNVSLLQHLWTRFGSMAHHPRRLYNNTNLAGHSAPKENYLPPPLSCKSCPGQYANSPPPALLGQPPPSIIQKNKSPPHLPGRLLLPPPPRPRESKIKISEASTRLVRDSWSSTSSPLHPAMAPLCAIILP